MWIGWLRYAATSILKNSPATSNDRDKFATYHRDNSTGLDYALNRYYGSTLGRFLTRIHHGASIPLIPAA
ncbi:MAG: hypothetical protein AB1898_23840 [Acidobacteriota bacterium]